MGAIPPRKSLTRAQRVRIFDAAAGRCHLCGVPIRVGERWDADHVIPRALSGKDGLGEYRPAHVHCHRAKTAGDVKTIAKSVRVRARHIGVKKPRTITRWRRFDGTPVNASRER